MNRKALLALVALGAFAQCWAVPIVSNVKMEQIEGTKDVRITYDLADNFNTQLWMDVSVKPMTNVVHWGTSTISLESVEGDAFRWVVPGLNKEVFWHAGLDWNGRYTDVAKATVEATIPNDKYGICKDRNLLFSAGTYWSIISTGYEGKCVYASSSYTSVSGSLVTKVVGPGTISYYWKTSSTSSDYVSLSLYVDGSKCKSSSSTSWTSTNYKITSPGLHTIEWRFNRGSYGSGTTYYAYVDNVVWQESP